jgi:hypothetical protein
MYGRIIEANEAAAVFLARDCHQLRGQPLAAFVDVDDRDQFRATVTALVPGHATTLELGLGPSDDRPVRPLRLRRVSTQPPLIVAAVARREIEADRADASRTASASAADASASAAAEVGLPTPFVTSGRCHMVGRCRRSAERARSDRTSAGCSTAATHCRRGSSSSRAARSSACWESDRRKTRPRFSCSTT